MITALWPRPHRRDMMRLLARVRRQADVIRLLEWDRDILLWLYAEQVWLRERTRDQDTHLLQQARRLLRDLAPDRDALADENAALRREVEHLDATIARLRPRLLREWT